MIRPSVALLAVLAATAWGAPQAPTFHAGAHAVYIYAAVVDRGGRPITDLDKSDFDVFDNGQRQDLAVFANAVQPLSIVVMLDRSGSMKRNFDLVRDAAERFMMNLLPADKARLGSFSDRVQIDPESFTSDQHELVRILHENMQDAGATPLWNATGAALTAVAQEPDRRVVLVFTDGVDSPSAAGPNLSFKEVLDRAQLDETMIYAIGLTDNCVAGSRPASSGAMSGPQPAFQRLGGPQGRIGGGPVGGRMGGPPPGDGKIGGRPAGGPIRGGRLGSDEGKPCAGLRPDPDLAELANDGGGAYFELRGTDDLQATFGRVADELHHQYVLAFNAPKLDGRVHSLEVRVRRSNAIVRARRSYLAPDADAPRSRR